MFGLTPKQRELLAYLRERETCPSYEEMCVALGLRAKSGVHRLIRSLEARGKIRRLPNCARSIEVLPETVDLSGIDVADLVNELSRRGYDGELWLKAA